MNKVNAQYGYWLLIQIIKRLTLWGILGLIMIMASIVIISQLQSLEQKAAVLQASLNSAQTAKNSNMNEVGLVKPVKNNHQEIELFYEMFPKGATLPDQLRKISNIAIKHHLLLNQGDYKLTAKKQSKTRSQDALSRYEVILPIKGEYKRIRHFVAEILALQPALALQDIEIKRENNLSTTVEARLVFVIVLKGDAW